MPPIEDEGQQLAENPELIISRTHALRPAARDEGIHVGQDDDAVPLARKKATRNLWVGKSTHTPAQVIAAQREGADYIGFGPIFATPTKPDYEPIAPMHWRQGSSVTQMVWSG